MAMYLPGTITGHDEELGVIYIAAPIEKGYILDRQKIKSCEIRLNDGRYISDDQRAKIYATMSEISEWSGYLPEEVKAIMKYDFVEKTGSDYFSLSNCDMTTASKFLEHLIEFCVECGIPCDDSLTVRTPYIARYMYFCVINRKCAICGRPADIHEYDHVGVGRNRKKIHHKGQRVQPLCRAHHDETEYLGQKSFDEKYHITYVKLDDNACEILKWKK